ncbi:MAG: 50S ribosomal protein L4 [Desulfovibrionaceae bacterium]|nr:50S ribosomal protein L4 [Desulfovibrionaceae bacterium]
MASVKVYDQTKVETGEIELAPEIFQVEVKPEILHLVTRAQLAKKRAGTHMAKTRAFVSGGGSKPWKQKGTGRARSGSNRSPVWRGGAIVFGPTPRNYEFKVNSKVRQLALRMALSSKLFDDCLLVVNTINLPEAKTKHFDQVCHNLELTDALFVLPEEDVLLQRSARNIPNIKLITCEQISVLEVLRYKNLVLLEGSVAALNQRFAPKEA